MLAKFLKPLEINLRITSIIILCMVSVLMLIPKMNPIITLGNTITNDLSSTQNNTFGNAEVNSDRTDIYVPPNYGGPESLHGSGTR